MWVVDCPSDQTVGCSAQGIRGAYDAHIEECSYSRAAFMQVATLDWDVPEPILLENLWD
jgi:hypothetical protein